MKEISGRIWRFGDHVNTDVIHPPDFYSLDPAKVKQGLFHGLDPEFHKRFAANDLIVAGCNFGCGSSRETSVLSLKLNRVGAIVAVDFARIFFRNATNNGIPCLTLKEPSDIERIAPRQKGRIAFDDWILELDDGRRVELIPVSRFILRIWEAGGLLAMLESGEFTLNGMRG